MGFHNRQYTAVVVSEEGATLYQLRRHQAARAFMRHKDRFAYVRPSQTVHSGHDAQQTVPILMPCCVALLPPVCRPALAARPSLPCTRT